MRSDADSYVDGTAAGADELFTLAVQLNKLGGDVSDI
jgi:hypothetical protein